MQCSVLVLYSLKTQKSLFYLSIKWGKIRYFLIFPHLMLIFAGLLNH